MRIAYIGQKGIPMTQGGIEAHVENLAIQMKNLGHEVFVYTRPSYTNKNLREYKGINLISLPSLHTKYLDAISHTFVSSIHACFQGYNIIHYHGVGPSLLSFIPRFFSKAKVVGTFHCMDRFHKKWNKIGKLFLLLGEYAICTFPNKTIAVSCAIKDSAKKRFHKDLSLIPNGFKINSDYDVDELEKLGIKPKKYFLAVTRIIGHKGLQYLIQAFNELNNSEFQLVIVGDTFYDKKYAKYIKELAGSNNNIIMTGQQQGKTLDQLFTNAHCFVIPSEGEGLSITLLEAMAHCIPVIASRIEGNQTFIDENLVLSFENKNINELKDKMQYSINNPEEMNKYKENARKYVENNYSWEKIAHKIESLYKSILQ